MNTPIIKEKRGLSKKNEKMSIYATNVNFRNFYLTQLIKNSIYLKQHPKCFFICVDILDKYLYANEFKKFTNYEIAKLVKVCFFLSVKFFNYEEVTLSEISDMFNVENTISSLKIAIKNITNTLDYQLYNTTVYDDMASKGMDNYLKNIIKYLTKNLTPNIPAIEEKMLQV